MTSLGSLNSGSSSRINLLILINTVFIPNAYYNLTQTHTHTTVCVGFPPVRFCGMNYITANTHTLQAQRVHRAIFHLGRASIHSKKVFMFCISCCTEHSDTFTVNISNGCLQTKLMPTAKSLN